MRTVGERIRQAREYRQWTGEQLAKLVGYTHQSAIANLENRATGRGGFKLPQIAQALGFPLDWFLNGPDVDDLATLDKSPRISAAAPVATPDADTLRAQLSAQIHHLSEPGLLKAAEYIELLLTRYAIEADQAADERALEAATLSPGQSGEKSHKHG